LAESAHLELEPDLRLGRQLFRKDEARDDRRGWVMIEICDDSFKPQTINRYVVVDKCDNRAGRVAETVIASGGYSSLGLAEHLHVVV
jgi:hypothetical protein